MKKLLSLTVIAFMISAPLMAEKSKLTIKNTVGADASELDDYDLYAHTTQTDINGDTVTEDIFAIGDELQADYESSLIDARLRLGLFYTNASEAASQLIFAPSGFVRVSPLKQLQFIAGTSFYKELAVSSAYLAAADDTTKYGRLLTDSLGEDVYLTSGNFSVYTNGFCGGVISDWDFYLGDDFPAYLKVAAGGTFYVDSTTQETAIDTGLNFGILNLFDAAFTAHNLLSDDRKFGLFAGLNTNPDLILNAGFYYNFSSSDYLPEACVERNDVYEYKKQETKYALGLTGGYNFSNIGLGLYADFITGLTNEYIGKIKYYDADGNLIDTVITTIVRGETYVKYKNGKGKRSDEYPARTIPYYAQLRLTYDPLPSLNISFNVKFRSLINYAAYSWLTLYPHFTVTLPNNLGKIGTGVRLEMNFTRYQGISSISIPLTYTYKFKKKF